MANSYPLFVMLALLALGCASTRDAGGVHGNATDQRIQRKADEDSVLPVEYREAEMLPVEQSAATAEPIGLPAIAKAPVSKVGLTLELVEELALANHPSIAVAQARLRALHGKWTQVGLAPNPTVGYVASEINSDGSAGQQGGFVGQEFVTAQKLERNRAIVCAEINEAEQQLAVVTRRVQTDVRLRYYSALLAQQRLLLAGELVGIASEAAQTSKSLVDAAEIPLAGLLQTELELQNAQLLRKTSQNELDRAWRQLQTLMGNECLPPQPLAGDVRQLPAALEFESQLSKLQSVSPEVAAAMADVARSRRRLNRECVEAVPNVSAQLSVQYDDANSETLTGVQIGIPLPLWDRNQGAICQAKAEVSRALRNVDRVGLDLQQRLADAFQQYSDARVTTETYAAQILTRSEKTLDLIRQGYAQGEVGYLDLLTAQRTFSQTNLAYLDALGNLWQSYLRIDGLLLEGSLDTLIP